MPTPPLSPMGSQTSRIDAVEAYLQKLAIPPRLNELASQQPDPYADDLLRELYGWGFFDLAFHAELEEYAAEAFSSILPILQRRAGLRGPSHDEALAALRAPHLLVACGDMRSLAWTSSTSAFVGTTVTGQSTVLRLEQAALYAGDYKRAHAELMASMEYDRARTAAFAELTGLFEQHAGPPWKLSIEARRPSGDSSRTRHGMVHTRSTVGRSWPTRRAVFATPAATQELHARSSDLRLDRPSLPTVDVRRTVVSAV